MPQLWLASPVSQLAGENYRLKSRSLTNLGPLSFATLHSLIPTLAVGVSFSKAKQNTKKQICAILKEDELELSHTGLSLIPETYWQNMAISHDVMVLLHPRRVPFWFLC